MAHCTEDANVEIFPEIDCLRGYPHPRHTNTLCGHITARAELAEAIKNGDMHHAWLFTGREGIGKATLAYKAAIFAFAKASERLPDLNVSHGIPALCQVQRLSHPGLFVIRRNFDFKKKRFPTVISIDEVRKLRDFLSHSYTEGHWRIVIIDSADELNVSAANALLKLLEEPPIQTVFFLISTNATRLLPTIRSRCRLLSLKPLNDEQLITASQSAFAHMRRDETNIASISKKILEMAGGSPRRLLDIISKNGNEIANSVEHIYRSPSNLSFEFKHTLADRLASNQTLQDYELFLALFFEKLAHSIKEAAFNQETSSNHSLEIKSHNLESWAELWETFQHEAREVKNLNLDRGAFILDILARLEYAIQT